jgi:hypothetical protein
MEKIPEACYVPPAPGVIDSIMRGSTGTQGSVGWFVMQARRRSWLGDALSGSLSKPNEPDHAALPCETTGWGNDRDRAAAHCRNPRQAGRQTNPSRGAPGASPPASRQPNEPEPPWSQRKPRGALAAKGTRATVQPERARSTLAPNEPKKLAPERTQEVGLYQSVSIPRRFICRRTGTPGRGAAARAGRATTRPGSSA